MSNVNDLMVQISFKMDTNRSFELKRNLCEMQFVMVMFEYLGHVKSMQTQGLNRRFYQGIVPHWMGRVSNKMTKNY